MDRLWVYLAHSPPFRPISLLELLLKTLPAQTSRGNTQINDKSYLHFIDGLFINFPEFQVINNQTTNKQIKQTNGQTTSSKADGERKFFANESKF